ncbi:MAG: polysaccharide pyruvyl transferase family protein [Lachnoclostridium sp.]|jgi:polysaccharide pyruvyl transferase WcaK-like protein|nr:polysaccharide pyruvyl transferase family protein [Lachnoclostridium sp.]
MKIAMYFHAGSKNHGCEALVRSSVNLFKEDKCQLYSIREGEDLSYNLDKCCPIKAHWLSRSNLVPWLYLSVIEKLAGKRLNAKRHYNIIHAKEDIALSIGGDNYCYKGQPEQLAYINQRLKKRGKKTVLWGCSIEPELLENPDIIKDLALYDLITVRESITREALENAGLTNVKQFADPAFTLDTVNLPLPEGFAPSNTIGINLSPLIQKYEESEGQVFKNYQKLIHYILTQTSYHIALIPHVVGLFDDDISQLRKLYELHENNPRIVMIPDGNCMELKGYISCCRMFIGARTHATIAAYSAGVPTIVTGYSVKARGIARDLFGTEEHYVLPVQSLREDSRLTEEFMWMEQNEERIREHLQNKMPHYIKTARLAGEEVIKWRKTN